MKEIYGLKVPIEWKCTFKLQVKPSSTEKVVVIDNAEIRITLSASGMVLRVEYDFLPVKESVSYSKNVPISIQPEVSGEMPVKLFIGYEFQIENVVIVPYYYVIEKQEKESSVL